MSSFMRPRRVAILAGLLCLFAADRKAGAAQWGEMPAQDAELDMAIPESPAFTLLGLTPQTVVRPATARELATSLLNGFDQNGNFQIGLALDFQPYMLLAGDEFTITDYRNAGVIRRILANAQLSLATTKGTESDDKATHIGSGLRLILWNRGDPRDDHELDRCFAARLHPPQMAKFKNIDEFKKAFDEYATSGGGPPAAESCRVESRERHWNATAWDFAAATSLVDPSDGSSDDLEFGGAALWSSFAYGFEHFKGFENTSQLIAHVRYSIDQDTLEPDTNRYEKRDEFIAGVRGRFGKSTLNVSLEGSYVYQNWEDSGSDSSFRGSIGSDFRVSENIWVKAAIGATAEQEEKQKIFVFLQVDWGGFKFDPSEIIQRFNPPAPALPPASTPS